ncbi:DUF4928 family protein [bacterium]|nr:DUF4928 family protein [bacterium]
MSHKIEILDVFENWYDDLPKIKGTQFPARGTIAAALIVLERLKTRFTLKLEDHCTPGKGQLSGISRGALKTILASFGETRAFVSEAGRTNRGNHDRIYRMLRALEESHLNEIDEDDRNILLEHLQRFLVEKISEYHNSERLIVVYDKSKTTWHIVRSLLAAACAKGKEGQVAEYLVGAKLQLRFPDEKIENICSSAADEQRGRPGDFLMRETVFHVTVAPHSEVCRRCHENLVDGLRAYLLVADSKFEAARQLAELEAPGKIVVQSIESFVAQNVDELASFSSMEAPKQFALLIHIYNRRVDEVELDKSLLIDIRGPLGV